MVRLRLRGVKGARLSGGQRTLGFSGMGARRIGRENASGPRRARPLALVSSDQMEARKGLWSRPLIDIHRRARWRSPSAQPACKSLI